MRIGVYWFGRPARSPFEGEIETYRRRVERRWPAADHHLKPVTAGRDTDPVAALAREAATLESRVPSTFRRVVLDERGRSMTSEAFAAWLEASAEGAAPGVAFILGSDLGLASEIRSSADLLLSLSSMTLPHLVARLLVWEQLFRATDILGPGRYHRR